MAYTTIDDPSAHFHTLLWTGNGADNRALTNDANAGNFKPDWVWVKGRSQAEWHNAYDSSRGANKGIYPNDSYQEETLSETFESFDTNGFTVSYNSAYSNVFTNKNSTTYVGWQWKANGGTTSSNTDGSKTATVQANQDAGFSIVTYAGSGSASTVGHGLADTPDVIIFKNRSAANVWATYHQGLGNNLKLELNGTGAQDADGSFMNGTLPTSSVFTVGASVNTNGSGSNYVAYCFAEKQGYSKFGKYVGNGNADGTFVYLGFAPAWLLIKRTNGASNWNLYDNRRESSGGGFADRQDASRRLFPNNAEAESANTVADEMQFTSNGFKLRGTPASQNGSGNSYIYMAFAQNPFTTSTGIPTTAR